MNTVDPSNAKNIYFYDNEHDKIVFHNTTADLQDQDHSMQDKDHYFYFFWK